MRIAVIGSGYVGLVSAACFAEIGHEVISVDSDAAKIAALERGETPIHEEFLPELLSRHRGARLKFSTSVADAVAKSEVIFITVGTPQSETGEADLSYVEAVAREVGPAIQEPKVIVEKSTVPVKTAESLRRTLLLNGARPGTFSVVSNPEFLREGTAVTDFLYPDRIVVGTDDEISAAVMDAIYRPLTQGDYYDQEHPVPFEKYAHDQAPIIMTDTKSAELIKHASNAFLAMKISFINAVANIAEGVGADIEEICKGMGSDSRIGSRFLNAGIGYGGSCFPKDVQAFSVVARQVNYEFGLLTEVVRINADQRRRFLKKVKNALWNIRGKKVGVLGLAFKGDTDDMRESPALSIIESLLAEGAKVQVFDPAAMDHAKPVLGDTVVFAKSAYDAAKGCDALLILTEWREFAELDLAKIHSALKHPIVIDGRNLYAPQQMADAGLIYHSIGRATGVPEHLSTATSGELRLRSVTVTAETMTATAGV
jgi:UDPglucose 6-dehydrogenase